MVVGHSIQSQGRISVLCGGQLVAIDIAISAHIGAGAGGN
eukprot:gene2192-35317_t